MKGVQMKLNPEIKSLRAIVRQQDRALQEAADEIKWLKENDARIRRYWYDEIIKFRAKWLLSPRERKILEMRFINRNTYEEVGKEFGVTRERIRQIECKSLQKIKKMNIDYEPKPIN